MTGLMNYSLKEIWAKIRNAVMHTITNNKFPFICLNEGKRYMISRKDKYRQIRENVMGFLGYSRRFLKIPGESHRNLKFSQKGVDAYGYQDNEAHSQVS